MKFPHINALVPEGEHFDESALNEGIYVSVGHFNAIEKALAAAAVSVEQLNTANATIAERNASVQNLNTTVSEKETHIGSLNQKVNELEAKVAELGGQSSGSGSGLPTPDDPKPEEADKKVSLLSADHPLNVYAAQYVAANKKK